MNRPPTGGAEPDGLAAPLPLAPPAAPPPLGSKNQNHWTVVRAPPPGGVMSLHYTTMKSLTE